MPWIVSAREDDAMWTVFQTPWGWGRLALRDGVLVEVVLPESESSACADDTWRVPGRVAAADATGVDSDARARWWRRSLEGYFERPIRWRVEDVPVDGLDVGPFRRRVYAALMDVPPGRTVSYGELARMAGHPRAARAVGTAMAQNPIPLVVPCHRVIRSDGSLGRYGRCDARKAELLRHEGAAAGTGGATGQPFVGYEEAAGLIAEGART